MKVKFKKIYYKNLTKDEFRLNIIIFFIAFLMIGITFNFYAITSNSCKMPVLSSYNFESERHFSFQEKQEINRYYLTDIFEVYLLGYKINYSAGDVFIIFSAIGIITICGWSFFDFIKFRQLNCLILE